LDKKITIANTVYNLLLASCLLTKVPACRRQARGFSIQFLFTKLGD